MFNSEDYGVSMCTNMDGQRWLPEQKNFKKKFLDFKDLSDHKGARKCV